MKKLVLLLPVLLLGCSALTSEEIARLEINKISTQGNFTAKEAMLDLKKDEEIAFWSDMDMEYKGDVKLQFKIKIFKSTTKVAQFEIDPTKKNITVGEVKTNVMDKTKWRFSGKNHDLTIEEDGTYRITSILVASENPSLKITKAELVIKK